MFECSSCHKSYKDEQEAIKCCTEIIGDEFNFRIPKKYYMKPNAKQHRCINVTHGGKVWAVWLGVDEKCPMCDYIYRPR